VRASRPVASVMRLAPARRRSEQDAASLLLEDLDDAVDEGGLPGARAARHDKELTHHAAADRLALFGGQSNFLSLLEPRERAFDIDGDGGRRGAKEGAQERGRAALGGVEGLEIDRVVLLTVHDRCHDRLSRLGECFDRLLDDPTIDLE
jgi:hypothetical protein